MKKLIYFLALLCINSFLFGQSKEQDSLKIIKLEKVIITANRLPITLKNNPGAVSLVTSKTLSFMPKTTGAEEALRLVPGVRIDNQYSSEKVHISIRGQGILTEKGLRGICVLLDGIPINDPSGFAPDLYDVDWATVQKIEVLRGPSAGLYGSSGSAGILNITTENGVSKPLGGTLSKSIGSNGFQKSIVQLSGTKNDMNYRVSFSKSGGDGYRDHQAYWSNKLYEKINFNPTEKLSITQIISHTDYFQQNPEGLSLEQFDNLRQANPGASPFNEYQKTNRTTLGFSGKYILNKNQNIQAYSFLRNWNYKETSNVAVEYRKYNDPGAGIQYNISLNTAKIKNDISFGTDLKWQNIDMYKLQSAANPNRVESIDETNIETNVLLANQIIYQQSVGVFALYKMKYKKFNVIGNMRYDDIKNRLTNKMLSFDVAKTSMSFSKTSFRLGASYNASDAFTIFANWSQGFMPPSTEELASNPVSFSGFNTHLIPATSNSFEIGTRGFLKNKIYYDITGFVMNTQNDFFRFRQTGRGNQEVFYGNAGNSKRYGIETFISINLLKNLTLQTAYTFADYRYTSAKIDPIYTDATFVLTTPPSAGQYLPNSPKHQLYSEMVYSINKKFKVSLGAEYQSQWAIYTDAKAYSGQLDPAIYKNWQKGFNLYNARLLYQWSIKGIKGEYSISARNFTGAKYIAFTEPDPDGNSYLPGPRQEFFGNTKIRF